MRVRLQGALAENSRGLSRFRKSAGEELNKRPVPGAASRTDGAHQERSWACHVCRFVAGEQRPRGSRAGKGPDSLL